MLRTSLSKAYLKRTIRPLYGWTQATPKSAFLDPAWNRSVAIWPGMGLTHTSGAASTAGELYTLVGAAADVPSGLCGLYIGGDGIDEVLDQGINALAVWVLGPDAEFEILAPAFDTAATWSVPAGTLVHVATAGATRGKLVPAGGPGTPTTRPVATLLGVSGTTKIIVGGLQGNLAS